MSNFCLREDIFTVSYCNFPTEDSDKHATLNVCDAGIGNLQYVRKELCVKGKNAHRVI
jgi:hypothetical protein